MSGYIVNAPGGTIVTADTYISHKIYSILVYHVIQMIVQDSMNSPVSTIYINIIIMHHLIHFFPLRSGYGSS